eukprot:jgi/Bigna1/139691/aug1.51_g14399
MKLTAQDIHRLDLHPSFSILGHPISRAEIVGTVVEISLKHNRITLSVDDGTGVVNCTRFSDEAGGISSTFKKINLGDLVRLHGTLATYRMQTEIRICAIHLEKNLNTLTVHWLESLHMFRKAYSKPSKVQNEFEERQRKGDHKSSKCEMGTI